MAKIPIPKATLAKQMNKEYEEFYKNDSSGTYLVQIFDYLMKNDDKFKKLVQDFVAWRKDPISSDREASAFIVACEKFDLLSEWSAYTLKSHKKVTPKKTTATKKPAVRKAVTHKSKKV